uniref:NADH dehydrogenase subunit 6 n=1 Tax=Eisenia nordenskioldi TaxID=538895 RepID=UPI0021B651A7|nr:NADH dehydrogenase subunit 6 [Eisenia nordenskioldi]UIX22956.1 NADH dehydrogenase subunit 6 [Eisenia nordenskioldi]UIX22969.1 NADH dehydrogenase subunit 6 [Eisenia nordenskioldi]
MTLTMYLLMMITSTLTLYLAPTPIILGVNILAMSLLLSAVFASFISSWFAFLVFLIYVGGMLVMFAYFLALTPNQHMGYKNILYGMISLTTLTLLTYSSNIKVPNMVNFSQGSSLLYSKAAAPFLILLALILLLTMVVVVKLTTLSKGPLRPFMF